MISKIIKQVEDAILLRLGEHLEVSTELVDTEEGMILVTVSYWDGVLVSENEFNLEPLIEEIQSRLK